MRYGAPYKGSKNKIAREIVDVLPPARHFYDLFAGGCAITHAAMLSGKWERFTANDLDGGGVELFRNAVNGEYRNESRWVSREMFSQLKECDPYIKYVWSFGNNGNHYLYAKEVEPLKKALHEVFFSATPHEARRHWRQFVREYMRDAECLQSLQNLERLQSLERLESLERLQSLQSLESLEISTKDYQDVELEPGGVIYCDIPYKGTGGYGKGGFDHERFYAWAERQECPVFVSEYWMPEDRFACVWERAKTSAYGTGNAKKIVEKLFIPKHQVKSWNKWEKTQKPLDIR